MHTQVVEKIKKLRLAKNIESKQMADKLNISLSAYNKLEAGKTLSWFFYIFKYNQQIKTK
jgi:transcriptional regulator with XRE-family HTH domain